MFCVCSCAPPTYFGDRSEGRASRGAQQPNQGAVRWVCEDLHGERKRRGEARRGEARKLKKFRDLTCEMDPEQQLDMALDDVVDQSKAVGYGAPMGDDGTQRQVETITVGKRCYVGNLSWRTSWQDLKDHFRQVGNVVFAEVMMEPGSERRSKSNRKTPGINRPETTWSRLTTL